ncbi:MAG: hypothetical protein ACREKB_01095 [Candidatus Rokuibacteriota bacterium]
MRLVPVSVVVVVFLALVSGWHHPVAAQSRDLSRVRILAVAPFGDENPLSRPLAESGSARLSALLRGGRFQIIDAGRTAEQLRLQGAKATDLISPSRTVALGAALGADAVLTGRVVQIFQEFTRERESGFTVEGRAVVDLRILEVGTRLILWQEEMACSVSAVAAVAMACLVRQVAARVSALAAGDSPGPLAAGRD